MNVFLESDFANLNALKNGVELVYVIKKDHYKGVQDGFVKFHLIKKSFGIERSQDVRYVIERVYSPFAFHKKVSRRIVSFDSFLKETRVLSFKNTKALPFDDIPF